MQITYHSITYPIVIKLNSSVAENNCNLKSLWMKEISYVQA